MEFFGTFWALVPPLVAIVLALITKETYTSLFVGIVVGALLLAGFNPVDTLNYVVGATVGEGDEAVSVGFISALADPWNAGIFMFLVILGILVALINAAGGSAAFGAWAARHIKTRVGAQLATVVLGCLIFVDDYFNCLTVGAVMRPVTDARRVSRAKLSYLIDSTAAPVCMIAPISSWAAAVSATAADLDTGISGIQLFVQAIPYNFYSLLTIVFVVVIIVMGFDYGPMAKAELAAYRDGELGSLGDEDVESNSRRAWSTCCCPSWSSSCAASWACSTWEASGTRRPRATWTRPWPLATPTPRGPAVGLAGGARVHGNLPALPPRHHHGQAVLSAISEGFRAMVPAILILTFALTLKLVTSASGADVYVHGLMEGAAEGLYNMLPAIIFLVALGLAFATGTSWGTFGILIPIVLSVLSASPTLLTIGISACLAGAVCGDHISPISDTTIMSSAGANVNHLVHVSTQMPYALTVGAISCVCFAVAGFVQNWMISLAVGVVLVVATLLVLRATVGTRIGGEKASAE